MTMPIDLVLVRHGNSEGNAANKRSREGDDSAFTEEFLMRHSSQWRLTDEGKGQAIAAGEWIRENFVFLPFDRYYTSEYLRAMETAAFLDLPDAKWYAEFYLRERDYGDLDVMTDKERKKRYKECLEKKSRNQLLWTPPNGESIATLCLRVDRVLNTLHRECSDKRVIIVCHGDVIRAIRIRLERLSQIEFKRMDESTDPFDKIHNGQILHYTRCNPRTGVLAPHVNWMRSICPSDLTLSRNELEEIKRPNFSNEDLLRIVSQTPPLVNSK